MKKFVFLFISICLTATVSAQWLTPQQEQTVQRQSDSFSSFVGEVARQHPANRAARVRVSVPSAYEAECAALLLNENGTLALDTPCTEALATAFAEQGTPARLMAFFSPVLFNRLGGMMFSYEAQVMPHEFRLSERGIAFFTPNMSKDFYAALRGLHPLPADDTYLADFFLSQPAPSAKETRGPRVPRTLQDGPALQSFRDFLQMLEADLRAYNAKLAVPVFLERKNHTSLKDKTEGVALILNSRGKTLAQPLVSSLNFSQMAEEAKGVLNIRLRLSKLGYYNRPDGVPYHFDGKVRNVRPAENHPGSVTFYIPFTPGSEVRKTLQMLPEFTTHRTATWWLEQFYPRVNRAFKYIK